MGTSRHVSCNAINKAADAFQLKFRVSRSAARAWCQAALDDPLVIAAITEAAYRAAMRDLDQPKA